MLKEVLRILKYGYLILFTPLLCDIWHGLCNCVGFFSCFVNSGDLTYFDGLSETILAVGLVKPKGGKMYMIAIRLK